MYYPPMRKTLSVLAFTVVLVACSETQVEYHSKRLGLTLSHPESYSQSYEMHDTIANDGKGIEVETVFFGNGEEFGGGIHIYKTSDPAIKTYVQGDQPLGVTTEVNGTTWQRFESMGTGNGYGYIAERDSTFYLFTSSDGPSNPVSDQILQSITFDEASDASETGTGDVLNIQ